MSVFALIKSGVVVNLVEWDGDVTAWAPPEDETPVPVPEGVAVSIGQEYSDDVFKNSVTPPEEVNPRDVRAALLSATDWTQLADIPVETREKWGAYRQELRNVPQQKGYPKKIKWPEAPQ